MPRIVTDPGSLRPFEGYCTQALVYGGQLYYIQLVGHGSALFSDLLAQFLAVLPCGAVITGDLNTVAHQLGIPGWILWEVVLRNTTGYPWIFEDNLLFSTNPRQPSLRVQNALLGRYYRD